jgi:Fuc2NAc and GlcNAc transferase
MIEYLISIIGQSLLLIAQYKTGLLFICSLILGSAGAWFMSRTPLRIRLMDWPNERSSHRLPIPRGGGFGILLAVTLAGLSLKLPATFLFSSIIVSLISFYGDSFQLSVKFRLFVQFTAALILVFPLLAGIMSYYMVSHYYLFRILALLIPPFTLVYIVGSSNFFNFMDGINGIAGMSGAIGFGLLGAFGFIHSTDPFAGSFAIFSLCISLACLGFLPFNLPVAKVFLGDVGSILLGFVFAGVVVSFANNYYDLICLSSFLFPFYVDELTTMSIRLKDHENLIKPHRRHLYQLLANELGITHWKISAGYALFQLLVGITIMSIYPWGAKATFPAIGIFFSIFLMASVFTRLRIRKICS